jgi:hypothetical protein
VINAVLSFRSAMIMPFASYFRSRAAFFTADEDGHAWTFLGGHLLNGPTGPCDGRPNTHRWNLCCRF